MDRVPAHPAQPGGSKSRSPPETGNGSVLINDSNNFEVIF
jgi:hypothetical protein